MLASLQFFVDPAKVTPRVTGVTFSLVHLCHVLLCHLCICVRCFFTLVTTSGCTDPRTAHSTHKKVIEDTHASGSRWLRFTCATIELIGLPPIRADTRGTSTSGEGGEEKRTASFTSNERKYALTVVHAGLYRGPIGQLAAPQRQGSDSERRNSGL